MHLAEQALAGPALKDSELPVSLPWGNCPPSETFWLTGRASSRMPPLMHGMKGSESMRDVEPGLLYAERKELTC